MAFLNRLILSCCLAFYVLPTRTTAEESVLVPVPSQVTDQTFTLPPGDMQALREKLTAFEKSKGSQIAVLIIPTTAPEDIEAYSNRVFQAWALGRKHIDDGVLLVVSKADRKIRIEVGRSLEGAIPDIYAKRIISDQVGPALKQGDYVKGINAGVDALIGLIAKEPLPAVGAVPQESPADWAPLWFGSILGGGVLIILVSSFYGRRREERERVKAEADMRRRIASFSDESRNIRATTAAGIASQGASSSRPSTSPRVKVRPTFHQSSRPNSRSGTRSNSSSSTDSGFITSSGDGGSGNGGGGGWSGGGGGSAGGGASDSF